MQAPNLPADGGDGTRVEEDRFWVVGGPGLEPVQAEVVAAALEDREDGFAGQQGPDRVGEAGQVALDELALQAAASAVIACLMAGTR